MKLPFLKNLLIAAIGLFLINHTEAAMQSTRLTAGISTKDFERLKQIPLDKDIFAWEDRVVALVNQVRAKHGLSELSMNKEISKLAKKHSSNMADGKCDFGHDGFDARSQKIFSLGRYMRTGENVAYTYLVEDPLLVSLDGWMESIGHRENILGDFNETGVGIAFSLKGRCYITQLFAKKR